jgi:tetratricopeptide (TPR) repeat protein
VVLTGFQTLMGFSQTIFEVRRKAAENERKKGRYDKAAKELDHVVREARQPGAPLQAITLSLVMRGVNYRDWAYGGARDKFLLAEQDYLELLRINQTTRGPRDVLHTKRLLGRLYFDWGATAPEKLVWAERWLNEWLAAVEEANAEKAEVLFTLAQVLAAEGRRPEAEKPLIQALAITDSTAGTESMGSAVLHKELGNFYWAEKRYDFAVPHLQWALHIEEKIAGPNSPSLEPTLAALAGIYKEMGDQSKSEEAMRRAIEVGGR